jgi:(1->4)-alpha-D-glucan 1-alpha-D-glucosylmutase
MTREISELNAILAELPRRRRTPVSTYRLQFSHEFRFKDAQALLPYLSELGITDCYASPILKARPGSMHGYDICDHNLLNPELGTDADYADLGRELETRRMGFILDFVPNHMGIDPVTNPWWRDVLENGQSSPYARFFDIHWNPIKPELIGKVLLPVLGEQYGVVLEQGQIQLHFEDGRFQVRYFDNQFPVDPKLYAKILRHNLDGLKTTLGENDPAMREFLSIITAFDNLPASSDTDAERIAERQREMVIARERLARVVRASPPIETHIRQAVKELNGQPGQPRSFDALHEILEAQAYRLAYWKTAFHEINYRRFFDINSLAGLRVEMPEVFPLTHRLTMRLIAEGRITGLRIDHPDGLYDPAAYFEALQDAFLQEWVQTQWRMKNSNERLEGGLPAEWVEAIRDWRVAERKKDSKGLAARPMYVVAEKILSRGESLDAHWAIDGTSGYDFLNDLNGLFIDRHHAEALHAVNNRFTGKLIPFDVVGYLCKKLIMSSSMASELNMLAYSLDEITERDRRSRDFTLDSLRDALKEVCACFPVYRTYINTSRGGATDRQIIARAVAEAKHRNPALESSIFDFIRSVLTPENVEKVSAEDFYWQLRFTMKFQQYTGPVQAKGLEDTAFYRYNVLTSLNEVGGDPTRFGSTPAEFHRANQHRQAEWRYSMLATATHDTKRGEDARARLNVLSEIPREWEEQVRRWAEINQSHRTSLAKGLAPDRNEEYLFYQTLLAAWPGEENGRPAEDFAGRLREFMLKALREAKLHTSWLSSDEAYESAVTGFVEKALTGPASRAFLDSFAPFARRVASLGMLNSLSQVVLKIGSPGVPDFYQGSELWDLSLVDPDNRRRVDYVIRRRMLNQLTPMISDALAFTEARTPIPAPAMAGHGVHAASRPELRRETRREMTHAGDLLNGWEDGRVKMFVTAVGLRLRQRYPALFLEGAYLPLTVEGRRASHVVAFARMYQRQAAIVVAPRLMHGLVGFTGDLPVGETVWGDTLIRLPEPLQAGRFRGLLTLNEVQSQTLNGVTVLPVAALLQDFPVGLYYAAL